MFWAQFFKTRCPLKRSNFLDVKGDEWWTKNWKMVEQNPRKSLGVTDQSWFNANVQISEEIEVGLVGKHEGPDLPPSPSSVPAQPA